MFTRLFREFPRFAIAIVIVGALVKVVASSRSGASDRLKFRELSLDAVRQACHEDNRPERECDCFTHAVLAAVSDAEIRSVLDGRITVRDPSFEVKFKSAADLCFKSTAQAAPKAAAAGAACEITSEPSGATVLLDGVATGLKTPAHATLVVGRSTVISLELTGFASAREARTPVSQSDCEPVKLSLKKGWPVRFISKPTGAHVTVDGEAQGMTPVNVDLDDSPHSVRFELADHAVVRTQLEGIREAKEVSVDLPLVSYLDLSTVPEACDIWVDGQASGTSPSVVELSAGSKHFVTIAKRGFLPTTLVITPLAPKDATERAVTLRRSSAAQLKAFAAKAESRLRSLTRKTIKLHDRSEVAALQVEAQWAREQAK